MRFTANGVKQGKPLIFFLCNSGIFLLPQICHLISTSSELIPSSAGLPCQGSCFLCSLEAQISPGLPLSPAGSERTVSVAANLNIEDPVGSAG